MKEARKKPGKTAAKRSLQSRSTAISGPERWADALKHLRQVDSHLRAVIKRIGPCGLTPRPDRFGTLVNSIVAQQISAKAAAAINQRLHALGGQPHQPARLLDLWEPAIRSVGLSASKARYVLNLAEAVATGEQIILEYHNSRMATEVRSKMEQLRARATGAVSAAK